MAQGRRRQGGTLVKKFFLMTPEGNPALQQKVIHTTRGIYLESYGDVVAFRSHDAKEAHVDKYWPQWSVTTAKYAAQFLGPEYTVEKCQERIFIDVKDLAGRSGQKEKGLIPPIRENPLLSHVERYGE
jgi:hypothetical protein